MMTRLYDFGSDELGVALNEHVRLSKPHPRVWMIQPYNDKYARNVLHKPRAPRTQTHLIIQAMKRMAGKGDVQTVIWDGFSNTAKSIKHEVALSGVNKDDKTKDMPVSLDEAKKNILNILKT